MSSISSIGKNKRIYLKKGRVNYIAKPLFLLKLTFMEKITLTLKLTKGDEYEMEFDERDMIESITERVRKVLGIPWTDDVEVLGPNGKVLSHSLGRMKEMGQLKEGDKLHVIIKEKKNDAFPIAVGETKRRIERKCCPICHSDSCGYMLGGQ